MGHIIRVTTRTSNFLITTSSHVVHPFIQRLNHICFNLGFLTGYCLFVFILGCRLSHDLAFHYRSILISPHCNLLHCSLFNILKMCAMMTTQELTENAAGVLHCLLTKRPHLFTQHVRKKKIKQSKTTSSLLSSLVA